MSEVFRRQTEELRLKYAQPVSTSTSSTALFAPDLLGELFASAVSPEKTVEVVPEISIAPSDAAGEVKQSRTFDFQTDVTLPVYSPVA